VQLVTTTPSRLSWRQAFADPVTPGRPVDSILPGTEWAPRILGRFGFLLRFSAHNARETPIIALAGCPGTC
jgi:hypothetical protein